MKILLYILNDLWIILVIKDVIGMSRGNKASTKNRIRIQHHRNNICPFQHRTPSSAIINSNFLPRHLRHI